mmetsp:Transcript_72151/g.117030  ORF Transcript_72151/g.117030 Transcript_72151/m.117030 type:complete len:402 (-) Transcript_72151:331-1536(-)
MSDSGEDDAGTPGEKKNFMYKIKALKRRTVHAVAKAAGKAEQTKDPEFDDLFERFSEVDTKITRLYKSAQKYAEAQKALADAGSEFSHAVLELYDKDPMLKKLAVEMESIHEYMVSDVSPQLVERWNAQVTEPIGVIQERVKEIKEDADRRKRYMADYDHYRRKKKSLEGEGSKDKAAEKVRENDKKLAEASQKYFAMNERLTARLKIADNNKAAMLNEPLMSAIAVQHDLFLQGSTGLQKLYATSKEPKFLQATLTEAEDLARLDSQVKVCVSSTARPMMPPSRVSDNASSPPSGGLASFTPSKKPDSSGGFEDAKSGGSPSAAPAAATRAAPPMPALREEKPAGKFVRALFAYEAAAEIELDLREGDTIKVLKEDDSGWWQGEVDGRVGWFPFNYIEVL